MVGRKPGQARGEALLDELGAVVEDLENDFGGGVCGKGSDKAPGRSTVKALQRPRGGRAAPRQGESTEILLTI